MVNHNTHLCTCRACNQVYIDSDPGTDSKIYPAEVIKKFKLQSLVNSDCPECKPGESELLKNLDVTMTKPREVQRFVSKITNMQHLAA